MDSSYPRYVKHGEARQGKQSSTYKSWASARRRCADPNTPSWKDYGGRGITVCARWDSYENFLADMGHRPAGTTLDRYPDYNGNYEPGNCRWATPRQQALNKRMPRFEYQGLTLTLPEWSTQLGIKYMTLHQRIYLKEWPLDRAFAQPVKQMRQTPITFNGKSMMLSAWARHLDLPYSRLRHRFDLGLPLEKVFSKEPL